MKYNELRRLAIRLAIWEEVRGTRMRHCRACDSAAFVCEGLGELKHKSDCPIAELEAEEAASTVKPAGKYEGEY